MNDAASGKSLANRDNAQDEAAGAEADGTPKEKPETPREISARKLTFTDILIELADMQNEIENYQNVSSLGSTRLHRILVLDKARAIIAQTQANNVVAQNDKARRR